VAGSPDVRGREARGFLILGHRELVARFDEVEEVIAHLGAFGARRFGGPYVHAAIDGHRVDGQNLDGVVVIEGQRVRERRLARGGGPTNATATCSVLTSGAGESEPCDEARAPSRRTPPAMVSARRA